MKYLLVKLLISALVCSIGFAEETKEKGERGERQSSDRQTRQRDRKQYRQRKVEVKDPAGFAKTQEKPVFSGPQAGEKLLPFKAIGVYGEMKGKDFDAIELAKGRPQVLILSDESGVGVRGLYGFSGLASKVAKKSKTGLHVSALFLGDDTAAMSQFVSRFSEGLSKQIDLMGISTDGRDGPGTYGLNRNVSQTIIFGVDGKVTHNFVFPQGMLYPDPHVLGAMAEVLGEDRETVEGWLNETPEEEWQDNIRNQRMRRGERMASNERGQRGDPQQDLRVLLGRLVEAGKITREEAAELFKTAFPER